MTPRRLRLPRPEALGWLSVTAAVAWVTAARITLVAAGPDLDSDAAAHALIGRRLLHAWRDIHLHWVWLPWWHVVHAVVAALGGSLETVRCLDIGLAALSPFLLALTLRARARTAPPPPDWLRAAESVIPFAAATLFALWAGGVETGESAEPEAFFQCAVLGACLLWERGAWVATGGVLALAALTRYEAWVLPPVFLGLWALGPRSRRSAMAWAIPGAAIAAWCGVHAWATHEPFEFLRVNREYVRDAWSALRLQERQTPAVQHPWLWYPVLMPRRNLGDIVWLCLPGGAWLVARGPRAHGAVALTLLAFITVVWARRMNLGLPRHFAVLAPYYATAAAAGLCVCVTWIASRVPRAAPWAGTLAVAASLWAGSGVVRQRTAPTIRLLRVLHARAYVSERRAADVVRANLDGRARAFCDQTAVEVFTGLPPERFIRWNVVGVAPYNFYVEATQRGHALVVSLPERVTRLRATSRVLYDDGHLVVLRREAPAVIDPNVLRAPAAE